MKWLYILGVFWLISFCYCEMEATQQERNSLSSQVRYNSERLSRHEEIFDQVFRWLQKHENTFAKMNYFIEKYFQQNPTEAESTELNLKKQDFDTFFANLTKAFVSTLNNIEDKSTYTEVNNYEKMAPANYNILEAQLHQQMKKIEKIESRIPVLETNSAVSMEEIGDLRTVIDGCNNSSRETRDNLKRLHLLQGNLSASYSILHSEMTKAREDMTTMDRSLHAVKRNEFSNTETLLQIQDSLKTLYNVTGLILGHTPVQQARNKFCVGQMDEDWGTCMTLGPQKNCHCFITSVYLTWAEAERYCRWYGMRLVSIESEAEYREIFNVIKATGAGFWTSGRRVKNQWMWTSTGESFKYTQWKKGEPNGLGHENCIELWRGFDGWNDKSCSAQHNIICEA